MVLYAYVIITSRGRQMGLINFLNDLMWSYILIVVLIGAGLFFSIKSKFVQFTYFIEMFRILGDKALLTTGGKRGLSSFQAFSISAASRVGTGNIAGVATAIATGGPGSVFWMWLIALLGAGSSFVESTLAQIYKVKDRDGYRGGPAYYMEQGLKNRWLGIIFAIIITFCFGLIFNSVQSNTISLAFMEAFGISRLGIGIVIAILTTLVIFGGVKRIARFTQVVVPVMAIIYLLVALFVVMINLTEIPGLFSLIIRNAFGFEEMVGGGMGTAVMMGIKRGLFSNEAGMGSAPNAAATATVTHPVKQGLIQTLGVFVDTILICSATAFMILLSDNFMSGQTGIQLTQSALSSHIGDWANIFIAIAIFLFAFSSVIGNYYYGETNIEFIKESKPTILIYRLAVIGMVLFGSIVDLEVVWALADLFMGVMALINIAAILLLGHIAFRALADYQAQRKKGLDPVFYANTIPGLDVEGWETPKKSTE
jgi:alanine or glycine:cation symporter, AGCS family